MNRRYRNITISLLMVALMLIGTVSVYTRASSYSANEKPLTMRKIEPGLHSFETGYLGAIKVSAASSESLQYATFGVYDEQTDEKITEISTGFDEDVIIDLPPGRYYLLDLAATDEVQAKAEKIYVIVESGEVTELIVDDNTLSSITAEYNPTSEPTIAPDYGPTSKPTVTPAVDPPGKLLIHKRVEGTGAALSGAVFSLHHNFGDGKIAELTTDIFGEATIELPVGDYYVRLITVPDGYILNTERISFRIIPGEIQEITVTSRAEPEITPLPTPTPGRLVIVTKAEGTGENLQGAEFDIFDALNDEHITSVTTNQFGEASFALQAGDYYIRQTVAPAGYLVNTDRIGFRIVSGEVRVVNVTNRAVPEPTPSTTPTPSPAPTPSPTPTPSFTPSQTPSPTPTQPPTEQGAGRLLLIKRADGSSELLANAVFTLHEAQFDTQIATLTTDQFGEATITLPAGDYYLRQIQAPDGYILNSDRINFQIKYREVTEITVNGIAKPSTPPTETSGRLVITLRAEGTGEKLQGADFTIYHSLTEEIVAEITTDQFGEASYMLLDGDYFLRQTSTQNGFVFNTVRIAFRIQSGAVMDINLMNRAVSDPTPETTSTPTPTSTPTKAAISPTPTPLSSPPTTSSPPSNTTTTNTATPIPTPETVQEGLLLTTRAEQTGNPISGAVFGVYNASSNARIAELTTNSDGSANLSLPPGEYFLREVEAPFGYLPDPAKIFFTISADSVVRVDVTNQRDPDIPDIDVPDGFIYITETGQRYPILNYVLGTTLLVFSITAAGLLIWRRRKRKSILDLA